LSEEKEKKTDSPSKPRRRRPRRRKKSATAKSNAEQQAAESKAEESKADKPAAEKKPAAESRQEDKQSDSPSKSRRRRPRRRKKSATAESTVEKEAVDEPTADDSDTADPPAESTRPKKKAARKRPAKKKAAKKPAAKKTTAKKRPAKRAAKPSEEEEPSLEQPVAELEEEKPSPKKKTAELSADGFGGLGLSDAMLESLAKAEYLEPTPIQAGLIPRAMAGVDVMGQARTGTGKTAAFAIPILEQLEPGKKKPGKPQAIILVPTRELAVQVRDECSRLSAGRRVNVVALYGGKPIKQQIDKLNRGAQIVVGTPGRVIDLMNRAALLLGDVRFSVLDEADRMLDIGFRPDIEKILRRCPQSRQSLLLSATIPPPVKRLAQRYMRDPEALDFSPKNPAVDTIEQFYFTVDSEHKFELLVKLIEREEPTQAIIFCRTKRGTDKVKRRLGRKVKSVDTIHGDLSQSVRDRVMRAFRDGKIRYLVATDVVGRGIDVSRISHIINYDIPQFCDDYVHRVGRAGRMGREGVAYTFVTPEEGNELTRIEIRINILLKRDEIADFRPTKGGKPVATEEQPADADGLFAEEEQPKPKPVFGSRTRRYRRAL